MLHPSRKSRTQRSGELRVLQDERALQVLLAMQSRRQAEVSFEKRTGLPEQIQNSCGVHLRRLPVPRQPKILFEEFQDALVFVGPARVLGEAVVLDWIWC